MKKNVMLIILMTFCLSTYAEDSHVLTGGWNDEFFYEGMTRNPRSYDDFRNQIRHKRPHVTIRIDSDGTGGYQADGVMGFAISRVEQRSENEFVLYLSTEVRIVGEVYITVIDADSLSIAYSKSFIAGEEISPYRRVTGPAKIRKQAGVINDTRVRLRTKPNLESDTWGFFNTGDEVTIIDKSAEMQKIGDMEDYWYKVQSGILLGGFPDGWVYGAFIDIED